MHLVALALALSLSASQAAVVRDAAAHYSGMPVEIVVERGVPGSYLRFARRLETTLRSAGLTVTLSRGATIGADCPHREGIRVAYTPERSGPATRIAESFQRSRVVSGSVPSCSLPGEGVLRFLIAS